MNEKEDFAVYNCETNEIVTAIVAVLDSNKYSVEVAGVQLLMSREHLMNTLRDMDERATYEKRLIDIQLKVAYLKPGLDLDSVKELMGTVWELSDDIDSYVEARGEDLEEELEEPIIEVRMDLADLGYPLSPDDADMAKFIKEGEAKHNAQK